METEKKRPYQGRGKRKDLASRAARCAGERNDARYIKGRGAGRGPLPEGKSFLIDRVHIVIVTCFWTAPLQSIHPSLASSSTAPHHFPYHFRPKSLLFLILLSISRSVSFQLIVPLLSSPFPFRNRAIFLPPACTHTPPPGSACLPR
ncbi:hypothetical protein BJX68DRAFT_37573 [Aspergillus pseudodeflectus]|uniref:Uncharacterized protein n=1 Tax=Aspergillus pseudodeflectus TaxID=176178 RepID=A0ABR4J8B4_9EURO